MHNGQNYQQLSVSNRLVVWYIHWYIHWYIPYIKKISCFQSPDYYHKWRSLTANCLNISEYRVHQYPWRKLRKEKVFGEIRKNHSYALPFSFITFRTVYHHKFHFHGEQRSHNSETTDHTNSETISFFMCIVIETSCEIDTVSSSNQLLNSLYM